MIIGDLKHTRSASSLAYGLSLHRGVKLFLVSPKNLQMRPEILDHLERQRVKHEESENPLDFISDVDVTYVTRLQKERFRDPAEAERLKGSYILTKTLLSNARSDMIIMHHLPRIEEIPLEIDYTPNARYFEQASNGVPVRMAFLYLSIRQFKYRREKTKGKIDGHEMKRCGNDKCITNQPREPILPDLVERYSGGEKVLQCKYCGRYTRI
jgi:aspartate carbamoyltransferase catalytic subunit